MEPKHETEQVSSYITEIGKLMMLEARLAKQSVRAIIFCWLFSGILIINIWLSLLCLIGYLFWYFFQNGFIALGLVVLSNIGMLFLTKQLARQLKKNLFFPHTRQLLISGQQHAKND